MTTNALRHASNMLGREIAWRGPQSRADTFALARHHAHLVHARVDERDVIAVAVRAGLLAATTGGWAAPCPDRCPVCGADLKRQGYPHAHQHADTGQVCEFTWDADSQID